MIKPLIKKEIKANYKVFLIFVTIITMYSSVVIIMYDPQLEESLHMMAQSMPQLFAAFGMTDPGITLLDFIINYLYGFIFIIIPFIFSLIMCYRLLTRYAENGSLAYLLATPHSRKHILFSQYCVLCLSQFILILYITGVILIGSYIIFHEWIDILSFLVLNCGLFSLQLCLGSLCFLSACLFQETKYAIGIGGGLNFIFILLQMLSQISKNIDFLKYLTPLTLFQSHDLILYQNQAIINIIILLILSFSFYYIGQFIFQNKDLSL